MKKIRLKPGERVLLEICWADGTKMCMNQITFNEIAFAHHSEGHSFAAPEYTIYDETGDVKLRVQQAPPGFVVK